MHNEIREGAVRAIDVDALVARMRSELGMEPPSNVIAAVNGKELLSRVRGEVARLKAQAALTAEGAPPAIEEWAPVAPRLAAKREYELAELTAFDDEDFVFNAYMSVLRRPPDAEGFAAMVDAMRRGATKVEILGRLRWSEEGLARGVHIDGLLLPYTLRRWEQKRLIGAPVAWLHGLLKLGVNNHRHQVAEAKQARETHELGRLLNRVVLAGSTADQEASHQLTVRLEASLQRTARLEAQSNELVSRMQALKEEQALQFQRVDGQLADAQKTIAGLRKSLEAAESRLMQLGIWEAEARAAKESRLREEAFSRSLDPLYADFEDEFRGANETIRKRVAPYLDWVREGGAIDAHAPLLDIGCGRGEWLELAREHGMEVRGIDLNSNFAGACRAAGLDVIEGDAIDVLRTLQDGSIGAITSMHLVEHLPFEVLIQLLDESFRVLRPGGVIALETPNPENLSVSSHWFFLDPTHRNPLPPVTLAWMVRQRGFVDPRIERLTIARDLAAPPLLAADVPGADSINVLLERLAAAADYSIVARKPNV